MNTNNLCGNYFSQEKFDVAYQQFLAAVNSKEKYLIVSDMDGTLLNNQSQLTPATKKIISALINAGHIFCLATGRPWRSSQKFYDQLQLTSLIANLNGSIISCPHQKAIDDIKYVFSANVLKTLIDDQDIMALIENIIVEDGQHLHILRMPDQAKLGILGEWFHIDLSKEMPHLGFSTFFSQNKTLSSVLIEISKGVDIDSLITLIKSKTKTLNCQLWSLDDQSNILEVNTIFNSKGNALKYFSSFYGIPLDKTIAFGDGYNDVSLIGKAHYGYAMKNAKTTTKFIARGVTKFDNHDDGVAHKLVEFFITRFTNETLVPWIEPHVCASHCLKQKEHAHDK